MLMRICGRCSRKVVAGSKCECDSIRQKEYDKEHRNKEAADFYHSRPWRMLQQAVSARANYTDEYIQHYDHKVEPGRIAHHIIPLDESPAQSLNPKNIVFVSDKTHKLIHDAYNAGEKEKKEMQARLAVIRLTDE